MNLVLFWMCGLPNLGFLQEDDLTWFVFSINVHPYLDYQFSVQTMAPLCRFQPVRSDLLDIEPESAQLIDKIGWGKFFISFNKHNVEVTRQFSLSLKENVSQVGNMHLVIYEDIITKYMKFSETGERWFNWKEINKEKWKQFLLPLSEDFDDKYGYLGKFLKPQWQPLVQLIIRYITCDSRFSSIHSYHLLLVIEPDLQRYY